jgi:hypothetical protein
MQDLPLNGRNWIDLTMLAPGSRQNTSSDTPMGGAGNFQLNIDGQEVTNNMVQSFGQPKFSRDSIAEFEFVSNRFDASQGRSMGVQINAITKSGTNIPVGTFSGYFRDDAFIAKDFIQDRVLPYQDQQLSFTYGGPIKKDRIHYFANYEYEHNPVTFSHSSPWPSFNFDEKSNNTEKKGWGPTRLPVHVADAFIVPRKLGAGAFAPRSALFRGRDAASLNRHRGGSSERQSDRQSDAGAGAEDDQRDQGRLFRLLMVPGFDSAVAEPSAGAGADAWLAHHQPARLHGRAGAQLLVSEHQVPSRGTSATISRTRSTRVAATT